MSKRHFYGYALGSLSESAVYAFINSFYLLFLTSVAGFDTSYASSIISICLIVESVSSVFVGRFSDNFNSPYGKRRPFIQAASVLLPAALMFSFRTFNLSGVIKVIYYLFTGCLARIFYSAYNIPYVALGAEITTDYDQRTRQRTVGKIFIGIGNIISYTLPLVFIERLVNLGIRDSDAWFSFAAMLAVIASLVTFLCWKMTYGCEKKTSADSLNKKHGIKDVFMSYRQLIRLKPMTILVLWKIFFNITYTLSTGTLAMFLLYRLKMTAAASSSVYLISVAASFLSIPAANYIALKFGKTFCVQSITGAAAVIGIAMGIAGLDTFPLVLMYVFTYSFAHSTAWHISYPLFYDVTEADEYAYGKRREGDITALQTVLGTIASAAIMQFSGILLNSAGFNAANASQPASAYLALDALFIAIPCVSLLLSALVLAKYPLSKSVHKRLITKLEENNDDNLDEFIYWSKK